MRRDNPAKEYPSDFDVIMLAESARAALDALTDHPAVRKVTAQRIVQRTIKYLSEVSIMFLVLCNSGVLQPV